jgi:RCC1 and BTB domain-containing protein
MEDEKNDDPIQSCFNEKDINLIDDLCSESSSQTNIYTKDIYIYAWGKNKFGELGINTARTAFIPSPVKSLKLSMINQVASGGRNSMILTSEGKILVCGSNIFNLLASDSKVQNNEVYQKIFKTIKFFEENNEIIKEISVAEFHSLALNEKGEIYGWGGNLFNKLGQTNGLCGLPSKIYIKRKIVAIACGDYHSCAISENGVLYTWGGGGESYNKGQCGHGTKKDVESPKKVEFFTKKGLHILKVACGGYHTIVMDEKNELYGFGKGIFGQCGYGQPEDTDIPKKIIFNDNNLNKIIDIKCGGEHTLFLSDIGRVYACGHGYFGQLGLGNNKNVKSPILVLSLSKKNIIEIASGWSHSLVLTDDGYVYSAGCGKFGELGLGENKNRYNYTWVRKLGTMNIKHIFAGGHHSWCIVDDKYPLKEKLIEPEPLEKPNFRMVKRKRSVSDKGDMSFNEPNNMRNKSSGTGYFNKNKNRFMNNLANSFDDFKSRGDYINNINTIQNNDFKKMINDYNDRRINTDNNIDNIIDYIDTLNSQGSKLIKSNNLINNENKLSNFDISNNKIDNYNSNNKEKNNYMSNHSEENINNSKDNMIDNLNKMDNNNNINEFDNNNNINDKEINNDNEIINEDDYLRNNFNSINKNDIQNNILEEPIKNNNNKKDNKKKNLIYIQQKKNGNLPNLKLFSNSKIQLQVIYTSLSLSHRFIRFDISNTNKYYQTDYNTLYNLIKNYLSLDKGNIGFKLQNDNEVLKSGNIAVNTNLESIMKDMKNAGMLNLSKRDKISYTIAIIYDYKQNEITKQLYESIEDKYVYKEKNGFMNMRLIEENQIVNDGENLESVLSKWTIDFYNKFKELFLYYENEPNFEEEEYNSERINEKIIRPRFVEMRPKIFQ